MPVLRVFFFHLFYPRLTRRFIATLILINTIRLSRPITRAINCDWRKIVAGRYTYITCNVCRLRGGEKETSSFDEPRRCRTTRGVTRTSDIKYWPLHGEEAPGLHLRVASSPPVRVGSVGKAGITRAKRPSRASRLIVWKMAYCLHLPTLLSSPRLFLSISYQIAHINKNFIFLLLL